VTLAHLHLILNHVPTVGAVVAVGLMLLAFMRRNQALQTAALEVLVVIAIVTLPVYTSGAAAQRELQEMEAAVSDTAMRLHQDVALIGFTVLEFSGFVAWLALWQSTRRGRPVRSMVIATTVLAVLSIAIMGRAATLGGEIRHPEIRAGAAVAGPDIVEEPVDQTQFIAGSISDYMVNSPWAWPAAEAVHFLGLSLCLGVLFAVNFRILGAMKQVSFAQVHRLLPWGMLGLGVNLITGMLFFVGQPAQYIDSPPFYWKVGLLMITGGNFLYLTVFRKAWDEGGLRANLADRAMALTSIAAWIGVLIAGRMLPFLGNAF
jgi:hypothetical protein